MSQPSYAPMVSIITPSFNQGHFIEDNILSVKQQSYTQIEHIVVDGKSTDNTVEMLKNHEGSYPLRWYSERDNGQSEAINKGIGLARGEILGWVNSDDAYLPNAVALAVNAFSADPSIDWIYGDGYWIDENNKILYPKTGKVFSHRDLLLEGVFFPQPSVFFKRELVDRVGHLDETIHTTMDFDYFIRMALASKPTYISSPLAVRRKHDEAKSSKRSGDFYLDGIRALDKLYSSADLPECIRKVKKEAYSNQYLAGAYKKMLEGLYDEAKSLLLTSLKLFPKPNRKEFFAAIVFLIECYLKLPVLQPGGSHRRKQRNFHSKRGDVYIKWNRKRGS